MTCVDKLPGSASGMSIVFEPLKNKSVVAEIGGSSVIQSSVIQSSLVPFIADSGFIGRNIF